MPGGSEKQLLRGTDKNFGPFLANQAASLPNADQAADGVRSDVCQAREFFVGHIDLKSASLGFNPRSQSAFRRSCVMQNRDAAIFPPLADGNENSPSFLQLSRGTSGSATKHNPGSILQAFAPWDFPSRVDHGKPKVFQKWDFHSGSATRSPLEGPGE